MTASLPLDLHTVPDGGFAETEAIVDGEAQSLILHRQGGIVHAWLNICPHAGRRLDWAPGQFLVSKQGYLICAVHGASFDTDTGLCVAGPCRGQLLQAVPVVADADGRLHLQDADRGVL